MPDVNMRLPAVILAGAPVEPDLKTRYSVDWQALVPISGKPMVGYVVDALKSASLISEISMVADFPFDGTDHSIPTAGSMINNLVAGVRACGSDGNVLIATSDIPFITPEAIEDFIERCGNRTADFYYPVVNKKDSLAKFPNMKRTYAKLAEGTFTGGNIIIVNAPFIIRNAEIIREVLAARKSVPRMAGLLGIGTLIRMIIAQTICPGAMGLPLLERVAGRALHAEVKAVPTPFAEIGCDVDNQEQIAQAEEILGQP